MEKLEERSFQLEQDAPIDTDELWSQLLDLEAAMKERNARVKQEYKVGSGHYELVKKNNERENEDEKPATTPEE